MSTKLLKEAFDDCINSFSRLLRQLENDEQKEGDAMPSTKWKAELCRLEKWRDMVKVNENQNLSPLAFSIIRYGSPYCDSKTIAKAGPLRRTISHAVIAVGQISTTMLSDIPSSSPTTTDLEKCPKSAHVFINCLYILMGTIDLIPAERHSRAEECVISDQKYAREACPKADEETVKLLGEAITRRRHYFEFCKSSHERLLSLLPSGRGRVVLQLRTSIQITFPHPLRDGHPKNPLNVPIAFTKLLWKLAIVGLNIFVKT
ncbi:hypothetical protein AJ79_07772 [Helicocarpus griseus UAMH5409]|uniref:Uncharacterized protein n=1 Tax=Helicocarpus griseus UAMH5409 TaxID=1447875 RepID=A0A2B7WZH3_9EURO|nr:hypothetical protein AJ79_07772 [Helicocarpus griseus UAMH5409]